MSGHTPGPWFCDGRLPGTNQYAVFHEQGVACVALIQPGALPSDGREDAAAANAQLIAASPELLKAAQNILKPLLRGEHVRDVWLIRELDRAVTKAAGEPIKEAA